MRKKNVSGTAVEETRRQLSFIEDPTERLRLLFVNNLRRDAETELKAVIEKGIYFEDSSRSQGVALCGATRTSDEPVVCSKDHAVYFTISGMAKFFGWQSQKTQMFANDLLGKAIEISSVDLKREIASWAGSHEINATAKIYTMYRPEGVKQKPFRDAVERWILLSYFYASNYFFDYLGQKFDAEWLGVDTPHHHAQHGERDYAEKIIGHYAFRLNALADKLQQLGMTEEEVQDAFYRWLEKYRDGGLDLIYVAAVVSTKVLPYQSDRRNAALFRMTDSALDSLFMGRHDCDYITASLARQGMNTDPALPKKYADLLALALSKGELGRAYEINGLLGGALLAKKFEISSVVASAFDKAVAAGNFGVAAALVLQFGDEACFDAGLLRARARKQAKRDWRVLFSQLVEERHTQIRESFGIAKAAGQSIRFDMVMPYLKSY